MGRCAEASGLSSFSLEEVHRVAPRAPEQGSCRLSVANAVKVFIDLGIGIWICVFSGSPKGSTPVCAARFPCAISLCGSSAHDSADNGCGVSVYGRWGGAAAFPEIQANLIDYLSGKPLIGICHLLSGAGAATLLRILLVVAELSGCFGEL